jgi:hypothetical protein
VRVRAGSPAVSIGAGTGATLASPAAILKALRSAQADLAELTTQLQALKPAAKSKAKPAAQSS